jgi:hypothetical protein
MNERRGGDRYVISFPIRVRWKDDSGKPMTEEGLTENVGPSSTLIYLPRHLPTVGSKVELTVTENVRHGQGRGHTSRAQRRPPAGRTYAHRSASRLEEKGMGTRGRDHRERKA